MKKDEIAQEVLRKLNARPDMQHIDGKYLGDTVYDAINDVYDFINANSEDDLVEGLITPIKDICVVRLNLTGSEGLTASSKAGTSESFADGIPKSTRAKLRKYRNLP